MPFFSLLWVDERETRHASLPFACRSPDSMGKGGRFPSPQKPLVRLSVYS